MENIRETMAKGRDIILDRRGLGDGDRRALKEAIEHEGISGRVLWYP
jgi:hypothetical protein